VAGHRVKKLVPVEKFMAVGINESISSFFLVMKKGKNIFFRPVVFFVDA